MFPSSSLSRISAACLVRHLTINHNNGFKVSVLYLSTNSENEGPEKQFQEIELPPEPQNCCMSGCANCVWVQYAENLAKILRDNGETAKKKIMEQVKDPNLRSFLMLELSNLFKKQ